MITTPDVEPRYRPAKGCKDRVLWHPCSVCGDIWGGSRGVGFNPKFGQMGTWYCSECFKRKDDGAVHTG